MLALLGVAPSTRAEEAALKLFHGPDDTGTMSLKALRVALDGKDLGVAFTPGTSSETAFYAGEVAPGVHRLEFEASLARPSRVFTYMDGYRVTLRSTLDIEVPASKGIAIRSRIVPKGGSITTQWHEENGMALTLTASDGPPAPVAAPAQAPAAVAVAAEPEHPAPVPAAASGALVASRGAAPVAAGAVGSGEPDAGARAAQAPPAATAAPGPAPSGARACTLAPVRFAFADAALSEAARASLERFAGCIAAGPSSLVVVGHTDSRGPDDFNKRLGMRRAAAVSTFLEAHGVASPRIATRSSGKSRPLCDEAAERCWARNRRVEVTTGR